MRAPGRHASLMGGLASTSPTPSTTSLGLLLKRRQSARNLRWSKAFDSECVPTLGIEKVVYREAPVPQGASHLPLMIFINRNAWIRPVRRLLRSRIRRPVRHSDEPHSTALDQTNHFWHLAEAGQGGFAELAAVHDYTGPAIQ